MPTDFFPFSSPSLSVVSTLIHLPEAASLSSLAFCLGLKAETVTLHLQQKVCTTPRCSGRTPRLGTTAKPHRMLLLSLVFRNKPCQESQSGKKNVVKKYSRGFFSPSSSLTQPTRTAGTTAAPIPHEAQGWAQRGGSTVRAGCGCAAGPSADHHRIKRPSRHKTYFASAAPRACAAVSPQGAGIKVLYERCRPPLHLGAHYTHT